MNKGAPIGLVLLLLIVLASGNNPLESLIPILGVQFLTQVDRILHALAAGTTVASADEAMEDCWTKSETFKGLCISNHLCLLACIDEGHTEGGKCRGAILRKCWCDVGPCP